MHERLSYSDISKHLQWKGPVFQLKPKTVLKLVWGCAVCLYGTALELQSVSVEMMMLVIIG